MNQFPSFVEYSGSNIITGYTAWENFGKRNKFVVAAVKRLIGQPYEEYEKLDDKETLREIQEDEDRNIKVYIGSESNIDEDVTVIKTTFKNNNNEESTLAIVGPKRMDYERVVSMLEFLKENIEKSD